MGRPVISRIYKDNEIVLFYAITVGMGLFALFLVAVQREWSLSGLISLIVLGFLYLGWPLTAEVTEDEKIVFKGPLRRTVITSNNLTRVKVIRAHDYGVHVSIRARGNIPIGYRCRKYTNAPELAHAVLHIIEISNSARVDDKALKLLNKIAKGKANPLPKN